VENVLINIVNGAERGVKNMSAKSICKDCTRHFKYGLKDQKGKDSCSSVELPHGRFPKYIKECKLFKSK